MKKILLPMTLLLILPAACRVDQSVVQLPRPNSGTYSFEQAEIRKPEIYALSPSPMKANWENPYSGFCVHINKSDEIVIYNSYIADGNMSINKVKTILENYHMMQSGNPLGVLITSEYNPKRSKRLPELLTILFKPSVQIFYIK